MTLDPMNFIEEPPLKIFLNQLGWKVIKPKYYKNYVLFKPDFYEEGHVFALSEPYGKGRVHADGNTVIEYRNETFKNTQTLLERFGNDCINDFDNWKFIEEKEWVITEKGEFISSFTSLDTVPQRKSLR